MTTAGDKANPETAALPRGLSWTVVDAGTDVILCIPALSRRAPEKAELSILPSAPALQQGPGAPLVLTLTYPDGRRRRLAMLRHDEAVIERIAALADLPIAESEADGTRRHVYLATVVDRRRAAAPPAGRTR